MYTRVATFEFDNPDQIDQVVENISKSPGPPPGVPGKRFLMLADRESGKALAIGFFETEEDMHTGDAALNAMNPPTDMGKRVSVEMYEVAIEVSA